MSKLDEVKERISYLRGFLTIIFGMLMLVIGGLVNLYLKDNISEVFWLGFIVIIFLLIAAFRVMVKVEIHIKELGDL